MMTDARQDRASRQSYTYFTWRNAQPASSSEYVEQLAEPPWVEYYRPNFFAEHAGHPARLPAGRRPPGLRARLVLAATLSPIYGIYSASSTARTCLRPGSEEYLNSEKYEVRARDSTRPTPAARPAAQRRSAARTGRCSSTDNSALPRDANDTLICYARGRATARTSCCVRQSRPAHDADRRGSTSPSTSSGLDPRPDLPGPRSASTGAQLPLARRPQLRRLDPDDAPAHDLAACTGAAHRARLVGYSPSDAPRLSERRQPRRPPERAPAARDPHWFESDPLWYKDAIIYELHVQAFYDGNGDGIGDFRGLTEKLDYLQCLGVNCIWLLPFYPSPLRDDGYDIADYYDDPPRLRQRSTTSSGSSTRPTSAGCASSPSW